MPSTVPPAELPGPTPARPPAAQKWLVKITLLLSLLGLGRWGHYLPGFQRPGPALASQVAGPGGQPGPLPAGWRVAKAEPGARLPAEPVAALLRTAP